MADDSFIWNWNHSHNLQPGGGGTSDASNPDWNAQIAQEEQLRRQEAAIKAAEDYPSASVGSVADKGADSITRGHIRCLQSRLERPDCQRHYLTTAKNFSTSGMYLSIISFFKCCMVAQWATKNFEPKKIYF